MASKSPRIEEIKDPKLKFLGVVGSRLLRLVKDDPNPQATLNHAAERMMEAGLLDYYDPAWSDTPFKAVLMLVDENPYLYEMAPEIKSLGYWKAAETAEELISALLPISDHLL